jgi:hypothetical protein
MTDKSGEWVEETPDYDDPKSPVVDQLKFTFEEDWTVEDDDYSYEVETYSDDESTQEKNNNTPKTPNTPPATTKISPLKKTNLNKQPLCAAEKWMHCRNEPNPRDRFVRKQSSEASVRQTSSAL